MIHLLKTTEPYFSALWEQKKSFELRKNDRDFHVGDTLILCKYLAHKGVFTGCAVEAQVIYMLEGCKPFEGLREDYVILGLSFVRRDYFVKLDGCAHLDKTTFDDYDDHRNMVWDNTPN